MCCMLVYDQKLITIFYHPIGFKYLSDNTVLLLCFLRQYFFIKEIKLFRLLYYNVILCLDYAKITLVRFLWSSKDFL